MTDASDEPVDMGAVIASIMAEIDAIHATKDAHVSRNATWFTPSKATTSDRFCRACKGFGQLTDRPAYGPGAVMDCHVCGGHGFLA